MFRVADRRASDFWWVTNHLLRFYDVAVNWIVPVNSSAVGITEEIGCILRKYEMQRAAIVIRGRKRSLIYMNLRLQECVSENLIVVISHSKYEYPLMNLDATFSLVVDNAVGTR